MTGRAKRKHALLGSTGFFIAPRATECCIELIEIERLFDPDPAPGVTTIGRNYARGPGSILLNLRLSRTFAFGLGEGREAPTNIPGGGERRADASGVFSTGTGLAAGGARTSRRYNVTIGMSIRNLLNRNNPGPIIGNLTSRIFGQATYSRFRQFIVTTTEKPKQ